MVKITAEMIEGKCRLMCRNFGQDPDQKCYPNPYDKNGVPLLPCWKQYKEFAEWFLAITENK